MIRYLKTHMGVGYNRSVSDYLNALIKKELRTVNVGNNGILGINEGNADVPRAYLPIVVGRDNIHNTTDKTIVMIDAAKVRANEVDIRQNMGVLTAAWEEEETTLSTIRRFATKMYVNWLGGSLTRRFGLPYEDAFQVKAYLALYYYCAHSTPAKVLESPAALAAIGESSGVGAKLVNDIIENHSLRDVNYTLPLSEYVDMMHGISAEVKAKLSISSILATTAKTWVGETGVFYCNLAAEYPPAFATMLYFALSDRGYRKTVLATTAEQYAGGRNKQHGVNYAHEFNSLVRTLLKVGN